MKRDSRVHEWGFRNSRRCGYTTLHDITRCLTCTPESLRQGAGRYPAACYPALLLPILPSAIVLPSYGDPSAVAGAVADMRGAVGIRCTSGARCACGAMVGRLRRAARSYDPTPPPSHCNRIVNAFRRHRFPRFLPWPARHHHTKVYSNRRKIPLGSRQPACAPAALGMAQRGGGGGVL